MRCDLHAHTVHSDGSFTPEELVALAKKENIIVALTDHNTVSGLVDFIAQAQRQGVTAVGGVELSTQQDGREFHLLGLFVEPKYYARVEQLCLDYHELKRKSNIQLIERLREAGYSVDFDEVVKMNVKGRANRAHIAAKLIEGGYFATIGEAFDKVLDEKCGYYTPPKRISLPDAIRFLREIKAVPVLAHPLKEISPEALERLLPELKEAGLVAMETMHSSYDDEKIAVSKAIAEKFGLLESGGSDFHGTIKPGVNLGVGKGNLCIDQSVYLALLEYKKNM